MKIGCVSHGKAVWKMFFEIMIDLSVYREIMCVSIDCWILKRLLRVHMAEHLFTK